MSCGLVLLSYAALASSKSRKGFLPDKDAIEEDDIAVSFPKSCLCSSNGTALAMVRDMALLLDLLSLVRRGFALLGVVENFIPLCEL